MPDQWTVAQLREKIESESKDVGISQPDGLPVSVWSANDEYTITDLIFDDGEFTILVAPVNG